MHHYIEFSALLNKHLANQKRSIYWLAKQVEVTPNAASGWLNGESRPDSAELVGRLANVLGIYDSEERKKLLFVAGYGITASDSPAEPADSAGTITNIDNRGGFYSAGDTQISGDVVASGTKNVFHGLPFGRQFFIDAFKSWSENVFRWSEASEHDRESGASMVIYAIFALTGRINPRGLLTILTTIALWIATFWLVAPILHWTIYDENTLQIAFIKYITAILLIPLLVSFVTQSDKQELFELETLKQQATLWFLKFIGAFFGFWNFSILIILLAVICYYLNYPLSGTEVRALLTFLPLFWSYVAARRLPAHRYKTFKEELRTDFVDYIFIMLMLLLNTFVMLGLYYSYFLLADKRVGPFVGLIFFIAITLREYKQRDPDSISDPVLILILGFIFPVFMPVLFFLTHGLPFADDAPTFFMLFAYIFGGIPLGVTLFVRNRLTWTPSSIVATGLVLSVPQLLLLNIDLWVGRGYLIVVVLAWILWGRKRFYKYLFLHEIFYVYLFATLSLLALWINHNLPLWANALGFLLIFVLLMIWAYHSSEDTACITAIV